MLSLALGAAQGSVAGSEMRLGTLITGIGEETQLLVKLAAVVTFVRLEAPSSAAFMPLAASYFGPGSQRRRHLAFVLVLFVILPMVLHRWHRAVRPFSRPVFSRANPRLARCRWTIAAVLGDLQR